MKFLIVAYLLICLTLIQCRAKTDKNDASIKSKKHDSLANSISNGIKQGKGEDLFFRISDTIHKAHLTKDILVFNKWQSDVAPGCMSSYKFFASGSGVEYECELDEKFEIIYFVKMDTLIVQEFDTPDMDNIKRKRIKTSDDKFIYNRSALVMIDSKLHSINGRTWTADIQEVIRYERK